MSGAQGLRSARDFYCDLSATPREQGDFWVERERWLRSVQVDGREEVLFEFEMLLRAIERYFTLADLPARAQAAVVARDFRGELSHLRDALDRAAVLARQLLDPAEDQKMVFRKYVEAQLADDRARRALVDDAFAERSAHQSLFALRESLEAVREVIDHSLRLPHCPLSLFAGVGRLARHTVQASAYFRPLRPLEFRIEYDRIRSVRVLELLAELEAASKRPFTVAFLALFRLLHDLSYLRQEGGASPRWRVVLALCRGDLFTLVGFLRAELAPKVQGQRARSVVLKAAREAHRVCERCQASPLAADDGEIERQADELARCAERRVEGLAELLGSSPVSFGDLVNRSALAHRLRMDLWAFARLCRAAQAALEAKDGSSERALSGVLKFVEYFQAGSYQFLRYQDFEAVDRFALLIGKARHASLDGPARSRLAEDCRMFSQILDAVFTNVSRRFELKGRRFLAKDAEALLATFLPT